jgi:hypothetical protein
MPIPTALVSILLQATLTGGSLAGNHFHVAISYDASQVSATGDSFVRLEAFDFMLLGVPFTHLGISQGGQAIFRDGVLGNVTASFQGPMPPDSPVNNITFGFGGPGVIGYIDRSGNFGQGIFAPVPMRVRCAPSWTSFFDRILYGPRPCRI